MSYKVFIPVTDEILYEHPELITSPLRPYQAGNPCFHWMATIELEDESDRQVRHELHFDHGMVLDGTAIRRHDY